MPKVTEAHVEARRMQILNATCKCIADKGFQSTTMQDICVAADLSPGAVYSYFASKDEIIRTLAEESLERQKELFAPLKDEPDALRAIERLIELITMGRLEDTPEAQAQADMAARIKVVLWSESVRSPELQELFRASRDHAFRDLSEIVIRGQRSGQIDSSLDPDAVVSLVVSIAEGFTLQRALSYEVSAARYLEAVRAFLHVPPTRADTRRREDG